MGDPLASDGEPLSLAAFAQSATRARRSATICVAGHLVDEYGLLERRLAELMQRSRFSDSLGDESTDERVRIAEEMEALHGKMQAAQATFTFEYIGAEAWSNLIAGNKGDDRDAEALTACSGTLVEFQGRDVTDADRKALADLWPTLNVGQRDELVTAAVEANTGRVSVPFSQIASATLNNTDAK